MRVATEPTSTRANHDTSPGERATIMDGTLFVAPPTGYVWIWDLEIATSTPPEKRIIREPGSHPRELPESFGDGINLNHTDGHLYRDLKFINLVIHDTR